MADDIVLWLTAQRDKHAAARAEALVKEDWVTINREDEISTRFYDALMEITKLRELRREMEQLLLRRLLVAAREEKT